jgi:hypothetical protein
MPAFHFVTIIRNTCTEPDYIFFLTDTQTVVDAKKVEQIGNQRNPYPFSCA